MVAPAAPTPGLSRVRRTNPLGPIGDLAAMAQVVERAGDAGQIARLVINYCYHPYQFGAVIRFVPEGESYRHSIRHNSARLYPAVRR